MKKYTFRLEPVLKLRKLKEENCRTELGKLIVELNRIEDQILHDKNEISSYYSIQENKLQSGIPGNQLKAYSSLVVAKEKNIELLIREKLKQEGLIKTKKEELALLRGDLKVMEQLKEKDFEKFKVDYNKKINEKIEEQTQNWLQFQKKSS